MRFKTSLLAVITFLFTTTCDSLHFEVVIKFIQLQTCSNALFYSPDLESGTIYRQTV